MKLRPCRLCRKPRWSPFSSKYCPQHYAKSALFGKSDRTRARKCFRLTVYGPKDDAGNKWWRHNYPAYEEVLAGAELLDVQPEEPDEIDWKNLVMNMLNPDKRKVVIGYGRTTRVSDDESSEFMGEESPSQKEKLSEYGNSEWKLIFPPVPSCQFCDSPKEIVLRLLELWDEKPGWQVENKIMRPIRPNQKPEWFEFWSWVCPTCDSDKVDNAFDLLTVRNRIIDEKRNTE